MKIGLLRPGDDACDASGIVLHDLHAAARRLDHDVHVVTGGTAEWEALAADPASVLIDFGTRGQGPVRARTVRWHAPLMRETAGADVTGYALHLITAPDGAEHLVAAGVAPECIARLPPSVDLAATPADLDLLARWQAPAACWLAVAAAAEATSLEPLFAAFATYLDRCERDARLIVLHAASDPAGPVALVELARSLRLDAHVDVERSRAAALKAALLSADALLLTTAMDDPIAAIAAMQLGVPVVGGRDTAAAWAVGTAGLLWEDAEPALLAATLERVRTDAHLRGELRRCGFGRAERDFSAQALQCGLAAALERLA